MNKLKNFSPLILIFLLFWWSSNFHVRGISPTYEKFCQDLFGICVCPTATQLDCSGFDTFEDLNLYDFESLDSLVFDLVSLVPKSPSPLNNEVLSELNIKISEDGSVTLGNALSFDVFNNPFLNSSTGEKIKQLYIESSVIYSTASDLDCDSTLLDFNPSPNCIFTSFNSIRFRSSNTYVDGLCPFAFHQGSFEIIEILNMTGPQNQIGFETLSDFDSRIIQVRKNLNFLFFE